MLMVLVGIMMSVALPQFLDFSEEAREAVTTERMNQIKIAIVGDPRLRANGMYLKPGFEAHMGSVPTALTELTTQGAQTSYDPYTKTGWRGPYITTTDSDWSNDGWGTALVYSSGGRTITSYGPDEAAGGGDDIVVSF